MVNYPIYFCLCVTLCQVSLPSLCHFVQVSGWANRPTFFLQAKQWRIQNFRIRGPCAAVWILFLDKMSKKLIYCAPPPPCESTKVLDLRPEGNRGLWPKYWIHPLICFQRTHFCVMETEVKEVICVYFILGRCWRIDFRLSDVLRKSAKLMHFSSFLIVQSHYLSHNQCSKLRNLLIPAFSKWCCSCVVPKCVV